MKFTPIVNFKKVYQRFLDDVGFTIKMSGTITVALLIIYLIFALILNQIGYEYFTKTIVLRIRVFFVGAATTISKCTFGGRDTG